MSLPLHTVQPLDMCLLLRVHGEQRWLVSRVIPLLRQLEESGAIEPDELGPALAYLEVVWLEAGLRAAETDAAAAELHAAMRGRATVLSEKADRYHTAVRRLRHAVDRRVCVLTAPAPETAGETTGI
ncbi:MAG TPA: hypothetical protein VIB59_02990 [Solirubrobacteraceae bacterium]|jgi:hypothetical protein